MPLIALLANLLLVLFALALGIAVAINPQNGTRSERVIGVMLALLAVEAGIGVLTR